VKTPSLQIELGLPIDRQTELVGYLCEKYRTATDGRSQQVEGDYDRWINNYEAKPSQTRRNFPFPNSSNLIIPLGMIHTDITEARILGFWYAVRPFFQVRHWPPGQYAWTSAISQFLDFKMNYVWRWYPQFRSILGRTLRGGTCTAKLTLQVDEYISVTTGEGSTSASTKYVQTQIQRPMMCLDPIPFRDFVPYPFRSNSLKDAKIKFHTLRLTKEDVEWRRDRSIWDRTACTALLKGPTVERKADQSQIETSAGTVPLQPETPFEVVEAELDYALTAGSPSRNSIRITFNPAQRLYLRGCFNTNPRNLSDFIDFRLFPRDDSYYGYSMMQRLEAFQEEASSIHNDRRNAQIVARAPGWKKKRYVDNPNVGNQWFPGKVWELDDPANDLLTVEFSSNYNDLVEEERQCLELAERVSGVSPPMQGFGSGVMSGRRGIYTAAGTLGLLQEGNRRVNVYLTHFRDPMDSVAKGAFLRMQQHGIEPSDTDNYPELQEAITKVTPESSDSVFFETTASTGVSNREADRTSYLMMTQVLEKYYTSILQAAQATTQLIGQGAMQNPVASGLVKLYIAILSGAHDVANHLLDSFDYGDKRTALPDASKILLEGLQNGQPSGPAGPGGPPNALGPPTAQDGMGTNPDFSTLAQTLSAIASASGPPTSGGEFTD